MKSFGYMVDDEYPIDDDDVPKCDTTTSQEGLGGGGRGGGGGGVVLMVGVVIVLVVGSCVFDPLVRVHWGASIVHCGTQSPQFSSSCTLPYRVVNRCVVD